MEDGDMIREFADDRPGTGRVAVNFRILRIVSGGQTGVDRAALDFFYDGGQSSSAPSDIHN